MRRKSGAGESSNMRHEDIDDHQVEGCLVERRESAGAPSETAPQAVMSVCPERCISISRRSVDRVGNHPPRPIISWKRMSMKALPLRDRYSDAGCHGRARRNFHAR